MSEEVPLEFFDELLVLPTMGQTLYELTIRFQHHDHLLFPSLDFLASWLLLLSDFLSLLVSLVALLLPTKADPPLAYQYKSTFLLWQQQPD